MATLLGMYVQKKIPSRLLKQGSQRAINLCLGMVVTLTSIVLGLLTASAKNSFDQMDAAVKENAIQLLTLDNILNQYKGPEAQSIRESLRNAISDNFQTKKYKSRSEEEITQSKFFFEIETVIDQIRRLEPQDDYHRVLHSQAMRSSDDIVRSRWVAATSIGSAITNIHLFILWFWLVIIFFGFGLMSPVDSLMIGVYALGSISVAAAIFLMMELEGAFDGFIFVSPEPMRFVQKILM